MTSETFTKDDGTEVTPEMQARKAEMIGKLIAMSEDDSLPEEARKSYAAKAERLMREYRIDEENVVSSGGAASTLPIAFNITLISGAGRYWQSEFQDEYVRIWKEISKHAELKSHVTYQYDDAAGTRAVVAVGYGYEIDIRLAQFLWTAAHLAFATRIDTKADKSLSDQENCYYMRGAGMERNDIAEMLWGSARTDGKAHGKVQALYLAECAKRGEEPMVGGRGFVAARYRKHYAEGFTDQFGWRLRDARNAIDAESGALVLKGRKERVEEAYWAAYPDKAPLTPEERAAREAKTAAYWAEQEEEERKCKEYGPCSRAKTGQCRKHRPYETTVADRQRWAREVNAPERSAGRRAGAAAASSVDFRRTAGDRQPKAPTAERTALGR
jgi:uncharacterized protein DUF2786